MGMLSQSSGSKLYDLRRSVKLDQRTVANTLGVSLQRYQWMESGVRRPTRRQAHVLSRMYGVTAVAFWDAWKAAAHVYWDSARPEVPSEFEMKTSHNPRLSELDCRGVSILEEERGEHLDLD